MLKFLFTFLFFFASGEAQMNQDCDQMKKIASMETIFVTLKLQEWVILKLENFDNFNQIRTECISNISNYVLHSIYISPNKKLNIDNSFKISNFTYLIDKDLRLEYKIKNIKGFDLNSNFIFKILRENYSYIEPTLILYDSYLNSVNELCSLDSIEPEYSQGIFNGFFELKTYYTVKYSLNTCPLLFRNTSITNLVISGISDNFIRTNKLEFKNLTLENLNCSILRAKLHFTKAKLNRNLLNPLIFSNTEIIYINGLLDQIEQNAFEGLFSLRQIFLYTKNFRHF